MIENIIGGYVSLTSIVLGIGYYVFVCSRGYLYQPLQRVFQKSAVALLLFALPVSTTHSGSDWCCVTYLWKWHKYSHDIMPIFVLVATLLNMVWGFYLPARLTRPIIKIFSDSVHAKITMGVAIFQGLFFTIFEAFLAKLWNFYMYENHPTIVAIAHKIFGIE